MNALVCPTSPSDNLNVALSSVYPVYSLYLVLFVNKPVFFISTKDFAIELTIHEAFSLTECVYYACREFNATLLQKATPNCRQLVNAWVEN